MPAEMDEILKEIEKEHPGMNPWGFLYMSTRKWSEQTTNFENHKTYVEGEINTIKVSQSKMADKQRFIEENVSELKNDTKSLLEIAKKTERHLDLEDEKNIHNRLETETKKLNDAFIDLRTRVIIYAAIGIFVVGIAVKLIFN